MATFLINESRRIVLPLEAAVDAVLQLDWEHGGWLAEAPLKEARIETGAEPGLILCVQRPEAIEPETRKYSLPAVAAAIVHLCVKARIPLPRWQKRIAIVPEGFELVLEGTVEISRYYGPLPETRAAVAPRPVGPAPAEATQAA
jgi:hypothetical protein